MALIERARQARETLYGRYDQLNALWLQAEEELAKLHIPRPVKYSYHCTDYDNGGYDGQYLAIQKIKGSWKICHGSFRGHQCEEVEEFSGWTPITDCSVETRVEAANHLAKLQKAIVKSAEDFILEVDEAIDELKKALSVPDEHLRALLAERAKLNGNSNGNLK